MNFAEAKDLQPNQSPEDARWILGLESSCDETALALVAAPLQGQPQGQLQGQSQSALQGGQVLAERLASQTPLHSLYGGVVPEIAARAHTEILPLLAQEVLAEARRKTEQKNRTPDFVAATLGPGLVGGLAAGAVFARSLSWAWGVRFIPINHLAAHALSPRFASRVGFPYFLLLVSGGHCQLLAVRSADQFRLYGATRDDAAGEVFDKVGRALGFAWPGGPNLAQAADSFVAAHGGRQAALAVLEKHQYFGLPRVALGCETDATSDGTGQVQFPLSFSGLKTATVRRWHALQQTPEGQAHRDGLACAFEARVVEQLVQQTDAALEVFLSEHRHALQEVAEKNASPPVLAVAGGVGANHTLRNALAQLTAARGLAFCPPEPRLCTDNAVMIAHLAAERLALEAQTNIHPIKTQEQTFEQEEQAPVRPRWPLVP